MGEFSKISWCDASFNPWWLCTEVGLGCENCYAESLAKRYGYGWGQGIPRRFFNDKHWNEPLKWNEKAKREGRRKKVFCASMADWADNEVGQEHRDRLFTLIKKTDWLIWQLLTKRIGNAKRMLPEDWGNGYENCWFGITVVNQEEADRDIPKMFGIPVRLYWLSIEPQLSAITLDADWLWPRCDYCGRHSQRGAFCSFRDCGEKIDPRSLISWVIYGGESGPLDKVRSFDFRWARDGIKQGRGAGVAFFLKKKGAGTFINSFFGKMFRHLLRPDHYTNESAAVIGNARH